MNKNHLIGGIVGLLLAFGAYTVLSTPTVGIGGNVFQSNQLTAASTTAPVTVTSSTRILATSSPYTRVFAEICNDSGTKIYLNMDADKAASTAAGFPLAANTCYTIDEANLYTGSVTASSTDETSVSVSVVDYVL
jgi:hypothetical protein